MNADAAAVLNRAILDELRASVNDDLDFVVDLVQTYLVDGEGLVVAIDAALEQGDAAALVRPAHTLKSSSATVGAERLAATARELEMAGRDGQLESASEARERLGMDWRDASAALRQWMANVAGA